MASSTELMTSEYTAAKLTAQAYGLDLSTFPEEVQTIVLSAAEKQMTDEQQKEEEGQITPMEGKGRYKLLDGTMLKLIAMISMVSDHVGDSFFPDQIWMRIIGRMALPIFAFCTAEGFIHTHDRMKYLRRMGIFALISEIPFDLTTPPTKGR